MGYRRFGTRRSKNHNDENEELEKKTIKYNVPVIADNRIPERFTCLTSLNTYIWPTRNV